MRLVTNQRLWTYEHNGKWHEHRVDSIGCKWAGIGDRRVAVESDEVRYTDGSRRTPFYTDDQRAAAEAYTTRLNQSFAVTKAVAKADLPTLNKIAALLGLPEVVAWTPEKQT